MALSIPVSEIVEKSKNPLLGKHDSWERVLLGNIANVQNGFPFESSKFSKDRGVPLIRIRDVGADATDTNYVGEYSPEFIVRAGDLLIGMDGDFKCSRWRGVDGLLNQRVCRLVLKSDKYRPKFLDYVLPGYLQAINDVTSSVTVKHLSSKSIAEIPLPLPALDEQDSIVAEIEKQFSRLDEAVTNLKRIKANLKRYKASVLKAGVEGRLVETEALIAKREGRSYETGEQLLERILETRRSQWKGRGKYKEPDAPNISALPRLPEGWVWVTTEQVCSPISSGSTPVASEMYPGKGEVPFIKVYNLTFDGSLDFSIKPTFIKRATHEGLLSRSRVLPGDVLTNIVGPPLGKVSIASDLYTEWNINQAIVTFRPSAAISNKLLAIWLMSAPISERLERTAKATAGQFNLQVTTCRKLAIPLPPIAEQLRIVDESDRRLSLLREAEAQVDVNLQRAERLRQTILAKAFSPAN
ncbi:MAG TPA: restriction endonuclease subunit S [Gammaproteobacteria bacterium]